ncbi:MAG: DUF58 domain-containing protein [Proteobacteria bacterium]|nr:DUF58 domain-containing protein [Pseudomonadota bacterium]
MTLTRDRVYIIPTKAGLIFSLLLLTLLVGSINYEKNLGFVLTFLLIGIGNILLLSTWRNLAGLVIKREKASAVFAGEDACFNIQLINHQLFDRRSIAISHEGIEQDVVDCPANASQLMSYNIATKRRGRLDGGRFRLYTEFPGGLFIAWTWLDLSMNCIVYPSPAGNVDIRVNAQDENGENDYGGKSPENFSHLRKYHHGDNINRISWKAAAKTDELFTKEFTGAKPQELWIDWSGIPADDDEQRLSIMCALIIHANSRQQFYGMKLPELTIAPDNGVQHYHQCLTALALH